MMLKKITPPLLFFLFIIMALASIWPGLGGPFLFDDFSNLNYLSKINGDLSLKNIGNYLASFSGSPGRPISALSFLLNDYAWPSSPYNFKYTNALIHLLNGIMVYWLLYLIQRTGNKLPPSKYWPAVAAAIWIIHPIQISAQLLIVQRMTLLSASFTLLGCISYLKLLPNVRTLCSALAMSCLLGIFTIMAFLCKENGLLLPVFILILNTTLIRQDFQRIERKPKFILQATTIAPSMLISLALLYYAFDVKSYSIRDFNVYERLITQPHVIVDYLRAILLPKLSGSGIYYDDYPVTRAIFKSPTTVLLISIIASVIFSAWYKRKIWPVYSFAVLWFFGGHLIESTTYPLELYFEHRNYLPLLGPVVFITTLAFNSTRNRNVWLSLLAIWTAILLIITHMQALVWGDVRLLSTIWAEERPKSMRAIQQKAMLFETIGMNDMAFSTLYNGSKITENKADLIINALALACGKSIILNNSNLYQETLVELKHTKFSFNIVDMLGTIGGMVDGKSCPTLVTEQRWIEMSQTLLDNPLMAKFGEDRIRTARATFFASRNMPQNVIRELKGAYAFNPTVEAARDIGYYYFSLGNKNDAVTWLNNAINTKQPPFEEIVSSNKKDIQKNLDFINNSNH